MRYHYAWDVITNGEVILKHIPTTRKIADSNQTYCFGMLFQNHVKSLGLHRLICLYLLFAPFKLSCNEFAYVMKLDSKFAIIKSYSILELKNLHYTVLYLLFGYVLT